MSICILKGINTESIDKAYYPSIKQCYQDLIDALITKGFTRESIKIKFDDEQRQIHFEYEPDEIEALIIYVDFVDKLQHNYTKGPLSSGWSGDRYQLWHNKTTEDYLVKINELCQLYSDLACQSDYPRPPWPFPEQNHPYLSAPERKAILKHTIFSLYKNNIPPQGIFLSEIHCHQFPKQFLEENLDYFKRLGIKTLFFEFLLYDRHQALLDTYFASDSEELPPELAAYLALKDEASQCGFSGYTAIVKAAKKAGIRVVAIDSYPSILTINQSLQRNYLDNDPTLRLKTFNGYAADIITKQCHDEPYLVFLGFEHGYVQSNSQFKDIKSVAELLPNTCSIFLTDNDINYKCYNPPYFSSGLSPVFFQYSKDKEAGADIVESRWHNTTCKL